MTRLESSLKSLVWFTALLLLAGCGGAHESRSSSSPLTHNGIGPAPVSLGTAGTFAILSKTGITDVRASAVTGDVGTSPITGAALLLTCGEVTGKLYVVDAAGPLPPARDEATPRTGGGGGVGTA